MSNYGLEALAFQKSSQIGQALEKIFQKAIDYRDSIPFEEQKEKVFRYCRETLKQDFIKVYKDVLNINIDNIVFCNKWPSATFAVAIYIGNSNEKRLIEDTVYGLKTITTPSKEVKEIFDIYKLVDTNTGSFNNTSYNDREIFAVLYFDISAGLLLNHYVPVEIVEPLTAQELTAIYLHETGHFFSLVDRARYHYYVNERITKQLSTLCDKYDTVEVINEFNNYKNELLDNIKKTNDKDLLKKFTIVDKAITTVKYLTDRKDESSKEKEINTITVIISLLIRSVMYVIKDIFFRLLISTFSIILDNYDSSKALMSHSRKVSDQIETSKHYTAFEKDADEYTVRSGYGAYQISGLTKIEKVFTYIYTIKNLSYIPDYNLTKVSKRVLEYIHILTMFEKFSCYTTGPSGKYEHGLNRNKRLCQMGIAALKHTDPTFRAIYLNHYERSIEEMKKLEKFADNPLRKIDNFINMIITAPSIFIDNILTGRVNKDYFILQDQVEEIVNNKLYYYGNKFKSFLK